MTSTFRSRCLSMRTLVACGLVVLLLCLRVDARYVPVDVQQVPVERVIANLEDLVEKNPKDAAIRYNLARAHGMAYAQKTLTLPVNRGQEGQGVWFGYEPAHVPFATGVKPAGTDAEKEAARAQLEKAIARYRETIELDPTHLPAKLGYAWCLDQSGDKAKAISAYRTVVAEAWAREARSVPAPGARGGFSVGGASLGFSSMTVEGASYLIPLLDPERDRDEIATLRSRADQINRIGRVITPIAVPLQDGVSVKDMINPSARVRFDADGSGLPKNWTWISPKAGWLVYAPDRDAKPVTSALQMFGNVTFWLFWENGYRAMRSLDDNHDGSLSGGELDGLAIWQDRNSNGVDDAGEVRPLAAWGIVALSSAHVSTPDNANFAAMSEAGVTFSNGRTRPTYDILLYERPDPAAMTQTFSKPKP